MISAEAALSDSAVRISGAMCIYTAVEQKQQLITALQQTDALVLDLSEVEEMDSAGYQLLWLVNREAGALGKDLTLLNCSAAVDSLLRFFDATELLRRCVTRDAGSGMYPQGAHHE